MSLTKLDNKLFDLIVWAANLHGTQLYGKNSYWAHLVAVTCVALENGVTDRDTLYACPTHDLFEDCGISVEELTDKIGETATSLVVQCSFMQPSRTAQLVAIAESAKTMTPRALIVKCCDTIANINGFGSGFTLEEAGNHKWQATLPYRNQFAQGIIDRFGELGRPMRDTEALADRLARKIWTATKADT